MNLILRALSLTFAAASACGHAAADCQPQTSLNVAAIKQQVIVIGEVHGNAQTPAFVSGLVCSLLKDGRSVILALERDGGEQLALNQYLVSEGKVADRQALLALPAWTGAMQDGRNSEAVLTLIDDMRKLRAPGQRVAVLAMQQRLGADVLQRADERLPLSAADNQLQSRINDRAMADKLAYAALMYRGYTVVALAGNVHTATQRPDWIQDPLYQPVGQLLKAMVPTFFIGLKSEGGTSWNCRQVECAAQALIASPQYLPGSHIDAEVQLGKLTASPPAATGFRPAPE